jgi:serine/threonine-protein kinase
VLEFVPGETLAQSISRGPIPVEETLIHFKQVAEALDAAHEKGIIHRDLKPANIKLTPENKVKILDFGVAKALAGDSLELEVSESPTIVRDTTAPGIILGTAPYMSPEQARGMPVDKRTDIWAFGCCLFEALSGRKAFEGETMADIFAAILSTEPIWESLPTATPQLIRELIHRCLRKEAKFRLRDIGDGWVEIQETLKLPSPGSSVDRKARTISWSMATFVSFFLAAMVGLTVWFVRVPASYEPPRVTRFDTTLPQGSQVDLSVGAFAFSPDGTKLAFTALSEGFRRLYIRAMDVQGTQSISGTEGAEAPFFSPNGQWLGFFADGKLKKVSLAGGAPIVLCDGQLSRGARWDPMILYFLLRDTDRPFHSSQQTDKHCGRSLDSRPQEGSASIVIPRSCPAANRCFSRPGPGSVSTTHMSRCSHWRPKGTM